MEYYLPTTLKLVNTYREFDGLRSKVRNVTTAMTEIERTMDTIIVAFEKLWMTCFRIRHLMCQQISLCWKQCLRGKATKRVILEVCQKMADEDRGIRMAQD